MVETRGRKKKFFTPSLPRSHHAVLPGHEVLSHTRKEGRTISQKVPLVLNTRERNAKMNPVQGEREGE